MSGRRRTFKVGERIQEVVARELLRLSDPRFHLVTVTSVIVSNDLRHAKVFWVVSGCAERRAEVKDAFDSASGCLRTRVGKELKLRVAPILAFIYDDTLDVQGEVASLMARIARQ
jgi:ribosome-binding factor A